VHDGTRMKPEGQPSRPILTLDRAPCHGGSSGHWHSRRHRERLPIRPFLLAVESWLSETRSSACDACDCLLIAEGRTPAVAPEAEAHIAVTLACRIPGPHTTKSQLVVNFWAIYLYPLTRIRGRDFSPGARLPALIQWHAADTTEFTRSRGGPRLLAWDLSAVNGAAACAALIAGTS